VVPDFSTISFSVTHFFDQLEYALGPAATILLAFLAAAFTIAFVAAWIALLVRRSAR
jgi:hypothetical protein